MKKLQYVSVPTGGKSYCYFPYYCSTDTSIVFENLYLPVQNRSDGGNNLFAEGPGRFQGAGPGFTGSAPNNGGGVDGRQIIISFFSPNYGNNLYEVACQTPNGINGTLEVGNAYVKVNNTIVASSTQYLGEKITLTEQFHFFDHWNKGWRNWIIEGHCGTVSFYENGVLAARYIPMEDDNGVAGYYDENNQTMIYSMVNPWVAGPVALSIEAEASKSVLANAGETISIAVECENTWTVAGNTWLTLSSVGGTGDATITATAPDYSTGMTDRTDTLTFTDTVTGDVAEITIKQKKYAAGQPVYLGGNEVTELYLGGNAVSEAYLGTELVFSSGPFVGLKPIPSSVTFTQNVLTTTIKVKSSEVWSMTVPAWITASTLTGGTGETVVTLTATAQSAATTGTINITSANFAASAAVEYSTFVPVGYIHSQNMSNNSRLHLTLPVNTTVNSKVRITGKGAGYNTGDYLIGNGLLDTTGDWRWFGINNELYLDINNGRLNVNRTYSPFGGANSGKEFDFTLGNHYWDAIFETDGVPASERTSTTTRNFVDARPFLLTLSVLWIKTVQIWEGATLVFDGTAGKLGSDYGLYDSVGGQFITSNDFTIVGEGIPTPTPTGRTLTITNVPTPVFMSEDCGETVIFVDGDYNETTGEFGTSVHLQLHYVDCMDPVDADSYEENIENNSADDVTATYANNTLTISGDLPDHLELYWLYNSPSCEHIDDYSSTEFTGSTTAVTLQFPPTPVNEECQCWKDGGEWDYENEECIYSSGCDGDPECECLEQGGMWDPEMQMCNPGDPCGGDLQCECEMNGGTWDSENQECTYPE